MYWCEDMTALISADLDGMLTPEEARQLGAHLQSCETCSALARELRALHDAMSGLNAALPDGFADGIMNRIRQEGEAQAPAAPRRKTPIKRWYMWCGLAAVFALTIWGTGRFLLPSFGGTSGSTMAASDAGTSSSLLQQRAAEGATAEKVAGSTEESATDRSIITGSAEDGDASVSAFALPAPEASYGFAQAPLAGEYESQASDALTALEAGYLVLEAAAEGGIAHAESLQEGDSLVLLAEAGSGTSYQLTYTGLSEDGSFYRFELLIGERVTETWTVAVDGSSVGKG